MDLNETASCYIVLVVMMVEDSKLWLPSCDNITPNCASVLWDISYLFFTAVHRDMWKASSCFDTRDLRIDCAREEDAMHMLILIDVYHYPIILWSGLNCPVIINVLYDFSYYSLVHKIFHHMISTFSWPLQKMKALCSCLILVKNHEQSIFSAAELGREPGMTRLP